MEASVATPGQGAPAAGVQPSADGQGAQQGQSTAAGKGDAGFNWGMFPDVPVEQQELLEPHLRNVQGHVTRIESQSAPYKGLMESVSPEQVDGLVSFLDSYQQDPVAVTLGILAEQVENGSIPKGAVEAVQALMQGQQGQPVDQEAQPEGEQIPEWAQELKGRLDSQKQTEEQEAVERAEAEGQQMLEQAKTGIRTGLTEAGISADQIDDSMIVAAIIANDGDEQQALAGLQQLRQTLVAGFVQDKTGGKPAPRVQGDIPKPKGGTKPGRRDSMGVDKDGARQFLEQQTAGNDS